MADETKEKTWKDWLFSPEGMAKTSATVAFIVSQIILLVNTFRGADKAEDAAVKAEQAAVTTQATAGRVQDVQADVEQVKKTQQKVLMNQLKPE